VILIDDEGKEAVTVDKMLIKQVIKLFWK